MRYYYAAPEGEINKIYQEGIHAGPTGTIPIITLTEDFLMKKFIFDVYAHEVMKTDLYCLFEVDEEGINSTLLDAGVNHMFSMVFKICRQKHIDRPFIKPFEADTSYEGMGLEVGVMPVENTDKFTPHYKQKVLEYLKELLK